MMEWQNGGRKNNMLDFALASGDAKHIAFKSSDLNERGFEKTRI